MPSPTVAERILALGQYDGPLEPGDVIRDVWSVASTLLHNHGWDYCACQLDPCECVMRFMDDLAEIITTRHPRSRADD